MKWCPQCQVWQPEHSIYCPSCNIPLLTIRQVQADLISKRIADLDLCRTESGNFNHDALALLPPLLVDLKILLDMESDK
jgi:hypothetical protein